MRVLVALTALALLLGVGGTSTAQSRDVRASVVTKCPGHVHGIYFYRGVTRKWEHKLGREPSKSNFNASKVKSCQYVVWVAHTWQRRAASARESFAAYLKKQRELPSSLVESFACIHRYEGAWNANTGNGYYGGLQMDLTFQSLYGAEFMARWGTADKWPVWAQLKAAIRAHQSGRGFYPWPNTARACGLI